MASTAAYNLMCTDLGFSAGTVPAAVQQLMEAQLDAAERELRAANIQIDEGDPKDLLLLEMYAAWLYRHRVAGDGKPEMLQRALRNRQVRQVCEGAES